MKIPFNIKFRPQIESGWYKIETRDGRPARIICWDRIVTEPYNNCNIVVLVVGTKFKSESTYYYYQDGHLWNKANGEGDSPLDLFILTPEPELTKFEQEVYKITTNKVHFKEEADKLLNLAKKELCKGCAANLEGYINGRQDAQKEMDENRL